MIRVVFITITLGYYYELGMVNAQGKETPGGCCNGPHERLQRQAKELRTGRESTDLRNIQEVGPMRFRGKLNVKNKVEGEVEDDSF